uniref:Uncharacterized protein n=1 Tax=Romanomermis culicivorax TaxID=13658 RepID=A0A915KD46_ROMCU
MGLTQNSAKMRTSFNKVADNILKDKNIMHETDPVEAKRMAKHLHSPKWDDYKQNRRVRLFLMSTEKKNIVELVPHSFWGVGWKGLEYFGPNLASDKRWGFATIIAGQRQHGRQHFFTELRHDSHFGQQSSVDREGREHPYEQNHHVRQFLISTNNKNVVELVPNSCWGVAGEQARTFCWSNVVRAWKRSNYIGTIAKDWIDSVGKSTEEVRGARHYRWLQTKRSGEQKRAAAAGANAKNIKYGKAKRLWCAYYCNDQILCEALYFNPMDVTAGTAITEMERGAGGMATIIQRMVDGRLNIDNTKLDGAFACK